LPPRNRSYLSRTYAVFQLMSYSFPPIVLGSTAVTGGAATALAATTAPAILATTMATLKAPVATSTAMAMPTAPLASMPSPAMASSTSALSNLPGGPFIYLPSFSIALSGAVIFLLLATLSTYQCLRHRAWYFNLLPQAAFLSAAGMIARTHATLHTSNLSAFTAQTLLLMIPGSLIGIANIFTFTRLMWWVTPSDKRNARTLLCPPKWISAVWVGTLAATDIVKTVGMNLRMNPTAQRAEEIGLVLQFFVLAAFAGLMGRFMWMSRAWLVNGDAEARDWRMLGWTICSVAAIDAVSFIVGTSRKQIADGEMQFRAMYVVVEFDAAPNPVLPTTTSQGLSFVATHEWPFWFGDVLPILLMYCLYCYNHPGAYLPREYTRLRFKIQSIERLKSGGPWQLTISNPIPTERDARRVEEGKMFMAQGVGETVRVEEVPVSMPGRKEVNAL
jgi:RTA1 like protein